MILWYKYIKYPRYTHIYTSPQFWIEIFWVYLCSRVYGTCLSYTETHDYMYTLGSYTFESWLHQLTLMWARRGPEAGNLSITSSKHNWMALKCSCKLNMNSLVPSRPHPPAKNVWWIDLNFLWLAPCEMSNGIVERTIKDCYLKVCVREGCCQLF